MTPLLFFLLACQSAAPEPAEAAGAAPEVVGQDGTFVSEAFPPPEGYARVKPDDFGQWLQARPLRPPDEPVRTHAGDEVRHHARVIDLPMVSGDLQQCADSAIRMRAEWLKERGKPVMFHATSGDPIPWSRFAGGETPYATGNKLQWRKGSTGAWDDYLSRVFTWAGTASLEASDTSRAATPKAGDVLVEGGFPGHAVLILDVATKGDQTALLLAEGFMPAQSFHVEIGPERGWWTWEPGVDLGHWAFEAEHLRRFKP